MQIQGNQQIGCTVNSDVSFKWNIPSYMVQQTISACIPMHTSNTPFELCFEPVLFYDNTYIYNTFVLFFKFNYQNTGSSLLPEVFIYENDILIAQKHIIGGQEIPIYFNQDGNRIIKIKIIDTFGETIEQILPFYVDKTLVYKELSSPPIEDFANIDIDYLLRDGGAYYCNNSVARTTITINDPYQDEESIHEISIYRDNTLLEKRYATTQLKTAIELVVGFNNIKFSIKNSTGRIFNYTKYIYFDPTLTAPSSTFILKDLIDTYLYFKTSIKVFNLNFNHHFIDSGRYCFNNRTISVRVELDKYPDVLGTVYDTIDVYVERDLVKSALVTNGDVFYIELNNDNIHHLSFVLTDAAGNTTHREYTFLVDSTPPLIQRMEGGITLPGLNYPLFNKITTPIEFVVQESTYVKQIKVRINNNIQEKITQIRSGEIIEDYLIERPISFTYMVELDKLGYIPEGENLLHIQLIDYLDNSSTIVKRFIYDTKAPVISNFNITNSFLSENLKIFTQNSRMHISFDAIDNVTGNDSAEYSFDSINWEHMYLDFHNSWYIDLPDTAYRQYTLYIRTKDVAGNISGMFEKTIFYSKKQADFELTVPFRYTSDIPYPSWNKKEVDVFITPLNDAHVYEISLSNDHQHYTPWMPYVSKITWDMTDPTYGGNDKDGIHTIYVRIRTKTGIISTRSIEVLYDTRLPEIDILLPEFTGDGIIKGRVHI